MINKYNASLFCKEDISLIENYEIAVSSKTIYDCHHRREIDDNLSRTELIKLGLYYNRPASELVFIEHGEHQKLHNNGKRHPNYGKHLSAETRIKISNSHKGKIVSSDTRRKISESRQGNKHPQARPVYQMDLSGNTIKKWTCIKYAADSVNGWISNISKCCLGKRSQAYGFKWRYADIYTPPKSISEIKPLF